MSSQHKMKVSPDMFDTTITEEPSSVEKEDEENEDNNSDGNHHHQLHGRGGGGGELSVSHRSAEMRQSSRLPKSRRISHDHYPNGNVDIPSKRPLHFSHSQAVGVALLLFFVLTISGISVATAFAEAKERVYERDGVALAEATGLAFSEHLYDAILPLFSLAQFAIELEIFSSLAHSVGQAGAPGSLPLLEPSASNGGAYPTHRNVTGVCDEPALVQRFETIASHIKEKAKMDGILVNLQLVPAAVVCLVHPVNNTEDFPPGVFMDNSGAIGHDLLSDPDRRFIAEATVPADDVVVAGPLPLKQCKDCDPLVEQGLIVRLPIASDDNCITVNGKDYKKWGFAVAIINWNELVERSGIRGIFEGEKMEFQLTRRDRTYDSKQDSYSEKIVILAESPNFAKGGGKNRRTSLPTTNNEWEIAVLYCVGGCQMWHSGVMFGVVFLSFFIAMMAYIILSQRQQHVEELAAKQQQMIQHARMTAQSERDFNDFIAHEVRNPLAAALSACSFVSSTVNTIGTPAKEEDHPLLNNEARQSVQGDVHIIESSLHFINDLLRSMLDLHRVGSNQLTLDFAPSDIKQDILEPVASMLYHRDAMFTVDIDCPSNLIMSVDRLRLKQVILNLARNSSKFVEHGFIHLKAEHAKDKQGLYIYVEDSGPGIPLEKRSKLFSRFQESLDDLSQGTGIGLSLCKRLVDLMDGSIQLDESYHSGIEGKPGTRLIVFIKCDIFDINDSSLALEVTSPWNDESSHDLSLDTSDTSLGAVTDLPENMRVLFVDDDVVLRKLFVRAVKRIRPSWSVCEAASGESAIVVASAESFDMIFLDQHMMSVDKQLLGTETVRKLRSIGVNCLICGLSANDIEEPFLKAGADAFTNKPLPCTPNELKRELLRVINSREEEPFHGSTSSVV